MASNNTLAIRAGSEQPGLSDDEFEAAYASGGPTQAGVKSVLKAMAAPKIDDPNRVFTVEEIEAMSQEELLKLRPAQHPKTRHFTP